MPKWMIEGFQGGHPTSFSQVVSGGKNGVTLLLERLATRHLTENEITDATFESRNDFDIHRDKHLGKPMMFVTTGTDHH